jgi:hypothetical protein
MHVFGHSRLVAISLVFFVAVSALLAQVGTGSIQGTVTDSSGAVILNATVVAEHVETATSFRMDCRSGTCIRGYLWYNGYIPPTEINTHNAAGQCTGVCGVPSNYQPSNQPINNTPNTPNYGTNNVYVPMQNRTEQLVAYNTGLNPLRNQYIPGPWVWTVNSSLFKVIPINERLKLRLNMDFFNVFNMPGNPLPDASTGILSLQNSNNSPRELQWTMRLNW